jgi:hypothetical protein
VATRTQQLINDIHHKDIDFEWVLVLGVSRLKSNLQDADFLRRRDDLVGIAHALREIRNNLAKQTWLVTGRQSVSCAGD